MKHLYVRVTGSILVETTGHIFHHGVSCGGSDSNYELKQYKSPGKFDKDSIVIEGDLILDENTAIVPYASYIAEKCFLEKFHLRPSINLNSWRDRNNDILNKLKVEIPADCRAFYYNGLYISLCSSFELAVMDCMIYRITSSELIYKNAVQYWTKRSDDANFDGDYDACFINVLKYYINNIVYHRFEKLKSIYSEVLGIDLPNFDSLAKMFRKRNNIVHRYSMSNLDRMTITNATPRDIEKLSHDIETFMSELERRVRDIC